MNIPPVWIKSEGSAYTPDDRKIPVAVWGWGNDATAAQTVAAERLQRLLARIGRGEPFPDKYGYGEVRPLREEILRTFPGASPDAPDAIISRNSYGAQILNAARLLFLDIDFTPPQPVSFMQRLVGLFGAGSGENRSEEAFLADLYAKLRLHGKATFRVYRTAAGFRVLAVDQEFDPAGQEAQALMLATGTDPSYARLCRAQRSFRARLTPKPWRCDSPAPPGVYPRATQWRQQSFAAWLGQYEQASSHYATCRYLETIGRNKPRGAAAQLIELHDDLTCCQKSLPLA